MPTLDARVIFTRTLVDSYNRGVNQPLASDTDPAVEQRPVDGWRRLTPAGKLQLVLRMNDTVRQLALAGIRQRYPTASPREQFLRLAQVTLGDELARKAYPEIAALDGS
jgi:hypothetical protein